MNIEIIRKRYIGRRNLDKILEILLECINLKKIYLFKNENILDLILFFKIYI